MDKYGKRNAYLTFGFCVLFAAGVVRGQADDSPVYGIQVGAFHERESAEKLQERLQSTTCSVILREKPDELVVPFRVILGPFPSYMDAWASNKALPGGFPSGHFVTEWKPSSDEKAAAREPKTASIRLAPSFAGDGSVTQDAADAKSFVEVPVATQKVDISPSAKLSQIPTLSRGQLLSVGFTGKKNSQAVEALQLLLSRDPSDADAPAIKLRLARRLMAQKKFEEAKALVASVERSGGAEVKSKARVVSAYLERATKGPKAAYAAFIDLAADPALDRAVRSHAMRMAAGNAHVANEYTSAVLAFRQLEAEAPSLAERHEAALELCGLQFELVGRGKGTWDEVIVSCNDVIQDSQTPHETKATAALMRFEAMFHAGYINDALAACDEFLANYQDIRREYVSALTWKGALLVHANRRDEAIPVLKQVVEMEVDSTDKFGGHEPQARAAYWLAFVALQAGDTASRDDYVNYIKTQFPKSAEASKLSALQSSQISSH